MNTPEACPNCFDLLVKAVGPAKSEILIVGGIPGEQELKDLEPFTGWTGKNFRRELANAGLDYFQCRVTNLWLHLPNKDEKCLEFCMEQVLQEAQGKKLILLCGAETVQTFTGHKVSEVCGLWVDTTYFSKDTKVMAMFNPAQLQHGGVGEVKLSLAKFVLEVNKLED